MSRKQVMLIAVTALSLCAGVVAGLVAARLPAGGGGVPAGGSPSAGLAEHLDLTPDQREQMRQVWESVREEVRESFAGAQDLGRQRDAEIAAILNDAQKEQFARISKVYSDRFDALHRQRDQNFAAAVERTRKLLNDQQRRKYDELLKTHVRPDQFGLTATGATEAATTTTTAPAQ